MVDCMGAQDKRRAGGTRNGARARRSLDTLEEKTKRAPVASLATGLLPGIIGCTGAVVIASENSSPEAALVLKLRTESGQEVFLPISEARARQIQKVIGEFNRSQDFVFVEDKPAAEATFQ
jgi:hypothetical protein